MRSLNRRGLRFRSFSLSSQGEWTTEDADWNYKDVPHLNQVHTLAKTVPAAIGDEVIVTINIQKVAGVSLPIALANYVASDGTQVYYTTLLSFILVVETRINPIDEHATLVETTYHVGGPPSLMWAFPILRRLLTANYNVLMSEDLPMREQRGRLRRVGYRFKSDGRPRTFAETTDLTTENVIYPTPNFSMSTTLDIEDLGPNSNTVVGEGPGGIRLVRGPGTQVLVYQRVCGHEGASLDDAKLSGDCLVCPWHAKRVKPLATIDLADDSPQTMTVGSGIQIAIDEQTFRIIGSE